MDELNLDFIDNAISGLNTNYAAGIENQAFNDMTNSFNEMNQRNEDYFTSNAETDAGRDFDAFQKTLQRRMDNLTTGALTSQTGMSKADAEMLAKTPERVANTDVKGGKFDFKIGDKPEGGWTKKLRHSEERQEALAKTGKNLRDLPKESKEYAENVGDVLEYLEKGQGIDAATGDYYAFFGEPNPSDDESFHTAKELVRIGTVRRNKNKIHDAAIEAANNVVNSGNSDAAIALANRMSDKQKSELDINKTIKDLLKSSSSQAALEVIADPVLGSFVDKKNTSDLYKLLATPESQTDAIRTLDFLNSKGDNISDLGKTLKASIESVVNENGWNVSKPATTDAESEEKTTPTTSTKAADSIAETYNRKKLSEYYDPKGSALTDDEVKGMAKTLGKQFIANLKEGKVRDTWNDFIKGNARAATKVLNTLDDFWKHPLKNLKTIVNEVKNTNLLSLILGTALSGLDYSTTDETDETEENTDDENLEGSGGATGDVEVVIEDILDKIATGELDEGNVTTYVNSLSDDGTVSDKDKGLFTVEKNVSKDENKYNKGLKETPSDEEIKAFFKPAVLRLMSSKL